MATAKPLVRKAKIGGQAFVFTCNIEQQKDSTLLIFDAAVMAGRGKAGRPIPACHMAWESAFDRDSRRLHRVIQRGFGRLKRNVEYAVKQQLLDE